KTTYSSVNSVQLCKQRQQQSIKVYPTIANNYFTISGLYSEQIKKVSVEVVDAGGRKIMIRQLTGINSAQTLYFEKRPVPGSYFVVIRNGDTKEILHTQKIAITL